MTRFWYLEFSLSALAAKKGWKLQNLRCNVDIIDIWWLGQEMKMVVCPTPSYLRAIKPSVVDRI